MKLVTEEQFNAHAAASRRGAIEGGLLGGGVAALGSFYAQRRWAYYRTLPPSLKILGVIFVGAPALAIQAERRGLEYDKSQWEGDSTKILEHQEQTALTRWQQLSTREKVVDWAQRHEYSIIVGSWALSLGLAGGIISRNKYQTTAQKIVQARMWAQGLTIGIILTAAGLKTNLNKGEAPARPIADHSWMEVIQQQERDRLEEERIKARLASREMSESS
ncbi:HIG1 domain-containing protein [Mycena kentingensis (nom. inval.)]|nr:HIG1 domain-containing protein [Mycena kentingensis (nom. inval.)]